MQSQQKQSQRTPIEAFFDRVAAAPDALAMVQPVSQGVLREYRWRDMGDEVRRVAAYLVSLDLPAGSKVALFSKNCAEWIMADCAIWMAGHVSVPLYPTLTPEAVAHILQHSESKALFVGKLDIWEDVAGAVPADLPCVAFSLAPDSARKAYPLWSDIVRDQAPLDAIVPVAEGAIATIIYTSGTTGMPKGVMHSVNNLSVMGARVPQVYQLVPQDRMLSYLPLSHVAERAAVELSMLYVGQTIYFAEALETFAEDIQRARPTLFFGVPRIWTKFYQKASEAVPPEKLKRLLRIPILNRIVRKKVLKAMGLDQCRIALSGASALSPEVIRWYGSLGLEILEVYGMTENMGWSHATRVGEQAVGWVGRPHDGVEQRIADNGEILVRSIATMQGYFKDEARTRDDLTEDGWLRTGDVGEIDDRGRLRITGRVKEIFKTEKGKYVAPAPIENLLVSHPGIDQACVMGVDLPQPVALLCLAPEVRMKLAEASDRDAFLAELAALRQRVNAQLDPHERLDALVVVREEWAVENNLLTPTLKLKRNELEKLYDQHLPSWAAQKGVVWATA